MKVVFVKSPVIVIRPKADCSTSSASQPPGQEKSLEDEEIKELDKEVLLKAKDIENDEVDFGTEKEETESMLEPEEQDYEESDFGSSDESSGEREDEAKDHDGSRGKKGQRNREEKNQKNWSLQNMWKNYAGAL
eukprot:gene9931-18541_t